MNTISHSKYYLQLNVFAILLKARTGQGLHSAWAWIPVATKVTSSAMLRSARSARWSRRCLMTNDLRIVTLCSSVVANAKVKCHFHQSLNDMYVLFIVCKRRSNDEISIDFDTAIFRPGLCGLRCTSFGHQPPGATGESDKAAYQQIL